jgi:hypothetical protein
MQQLTLAQAAEFQRYGKKTLREQFLDEMEAVMPWSELLALVAPHYSKDETGRKPGGLRSRYGFTSCNSGLRCRTQASKMRCTNRPFCAASWASIWVAHRHRMRQRS